MRLKWPKVSVVMSTYKRPEFLRRAVDAILKQEFQDFELLVVDDGGGDAKDTLEPWHERFKEKGKRLGLIELERNSGYQATPKNVGVFHSMGSYIAFADDDDVFYPKHLRVLVEAIERHRVDLVYGTWRNVFGGGAIEEREFVPYNDITRNLILLGPQTNFISCSTLFSKSAAITALGPKIFNEELTRWGDWDVYRRMIYSGLRFKGVDEMTFDYHWHGENLQLTRMATRSGMQYESGARWTKI